jgi:hypothetical protein
VPARHRDNATSRAGSRPHDCFILLSRHRPSSPQSLLLFSSSQSSLLTKSELFPAWAENLALARPPPARQNHSRTTRTRPRQAFSSLSGVCTVSSSAETMRHGLILVLLVSPFYLCSILTPVYLSGISCPAKHERERRRLAMTKSPSLAVATVPSK